MNTIQLILAKVGEESIYLLNRYPSEIQNGKLKAFVRSAENHKGWQTVKKFQIVEGVTMPDIWKINQSHGLTLLNFLMPMVLRLLTNTLNAKQPVSYPDKPQGVMGLYTLKLST